MSTRVLQFFSSQSGAETSHISSVIVETCKVFNNTYVIYCFQMFQSVSPPQSKDVVKGFLHKRFFIFGSCWLMQLYLVAVLIVLES